VTEEESEIYDIMGLLLRRGGLKVGIPILVGALLVFIGLYELPWGIIAVAVGIFMVAYGVYQLKKHRKVEQRKNGSYRQG
jgi:uncharacterized membrane protein YfcA